MCVCVCLSVCLSVCLQVCLSVCLCVSVSVRLILIFACGRFGDSHLQDQINIKSLQRLKLYSNRFKELFGNAAIPLSRKAKVITDLLQQLNSQVHARKARNTDILTLSQEVRAVISH